VLPFRQRADRTLALSRRAALGNLTGATALSLTLVQKQLEMLHELVPKATVIALLVNPNDANTASLMQEAVAAARALGTELIVVKAGTENEIDTSFDALLRKKAGAILVDGDPFLISRREQLVGLAARSVIPAVYAYREYALAGGLMSYAPSLADTYYQAGIYTGRVLKGEKPADLPILLATKLELVINLKTARALGLTIPETLLATADEVIQ
jgi:putative tryptophan/tyrosine transport system substrate-binding protein